MQAENDMNQQMEQRAVSSCTMTRLGGGRGGEALLIAGSERTALYDGGMAYAAAQTAAACRSALEGRALDYILLSHTHYDHIGALPVLLRAFPGATVLGAAHAREVLARPHALRSIEERGRDAARLFGGDPDQVTTAGMRVDRVIGDGDVIDLGGCRLRVLAAPGHTACSLAFAVEPQHFLISSESVGVIGPGGRQMTAILKSYDGAMDTLRRFRGCRPERLYCPHSGWLDRGRAAAFLDGFEKLAREQKELIETAVRQGKGEAEILAAYQSRYWDEAWHDVQPLFAFRINALCMIRLFAGAPQRRQAGR